ncbi:MULTISPECIES: hypothetical protein [Rugamonas]|jgi:hypothetical protein|uniref:Uncharacterized protein n=1 Tax=Rugamonas rubra TaxID=758825 RepID=A0A1I4PUU6_9BURK|nr:MULTISPECIES: hypothetical protein [Rugamonas]WGG50818.1 hypothetical protein QC826_00395 [Rugamonas sp. DEMB1]SFM31568.1 hypothetical protein SAMN02982985_03628 [Rugamonas rubra]
MSTANNTFDYNDFAHGGYVSNVLSAARSLLAALFAVNPRATAADEALVSQSNKDSTCTYLSRMADDYEHIAPNLSAELRFMASRG